MWFFLFINKKDQVKWTGSPARKTGSDMQKHFLVLAQAWGSQIKGGGLYYPSKESSSKPALALPRDTARAMITHEVKVIVAQLCPTLHNPYGL